MMLRLRSGAAPLRSDDFAEADRRDNPCFPEIDCLRALLSADVLAAAGQRADAVGVGADRVLIASGALSEETYLRARGDTLGVEFEPLDGVPRAQCPIDNERLIESGAAGLLPLTVDDSLYLVVAPRGGAARQILRLIEDNPSLAQQFRFTTAERLDRFVLRCAGTALVARASDRLRQKWPALSAAPPRWRGNIVPSGLLGLLLVAAAVLAPAATMHGFELVLAAVFLAWLGLRLTGVFVDTAERQAPPGLPDPELPVYTIISALYREAGSVNGLLSAIERLDYPGIMAQTPQGRPAQWLAND
jgi:hypothetical protein